MKAFLHMKAIVVFILTAGIIIVIAGVSLVLIFLEHPAADALDPFLSFGGAFCLLAAQVWTYTIAVNLQERVPEELREDLVRFKWIFLVASIASVIEYAADEALDIQFGGRKPPLYFAVQIINLVASISNIIFISKQLKSIELKRPVAFGDYYGNFFAMLFHFIGIFWIQPEVNRIFADEKEEFEPDRPIDQL